MGLSAEVFKSLINNDWFPLFEPYSALTSLKEKDLFGSQRVNNISPDCYVM